MSGGLYVEDGKVSISSETASYIMMQEPKYAISLLSLWEAFSSISSLFY